jgi:hypothetical protein
MKTKMRTKSAKAKGRRLVALVQKQVLEFFPGLQEDDLRIALASETGCDLKLSPAARSVFPFSVECKNKESLNIWKAIAQAETNTIEGTQTLVVFCRNNMPEPYVALKLIDFMQLVLRAGRK